MKRVAAKFVPRLLSEDQKHSWMNECHKLKEQLEVILIFLPRLSLVTERAGATTTTQKWSNSQVNGRIQPTRIWHWKNHRQTGDNTSKLQTHHVAAVCLHLMTPIGKLKPGCGIQMLLTAELQRDCPAENDSGYFSVPPQLGTQRSEIIKLMKQITTL